MSTILKINLSDLEKAKLLFETLAIAPSYLSKRFLLKKFAGLSDEDLKLNASLLQEEKASQKQGQVLWKIVY